jgi:lysophospholipase L1-like esterase
MNRSTLQVILILTFFVVAGVGLYFFVSRSSHDTITNFPSGGTDIIAFGDSLIVGSGATHGHDFVSLLSEQTGRTIINLGVSGNTTADGLARLHDLDAYTPKVVLLLLGGNDHLKQVPIETTFANLRTIIEYIYAKGSIVLLLGVKGSLLGDRFLKEFDTLHATYHTAYVPNVLQGLFGKTEFMADPIHPNDAGNKIIAERVYPVLLPLLK